MSGAASFMLHHNPVYVVITSPLLTTSADFVYLISIVCLFMHGWVHISIIYICFKKKKKDSQLCWCVRLLHKNWLTSRINHLPFMYYAQCCRCPKKKKKKEGVFLTEINWIHLCFIMNRIECVHVFLLDGNESTIWLLPHSHAVAGV